MSYFDQAFDMCPSCRKYWVTFKEDDGTEWTKYECLNCGEEFDKEEIRGDSVKNSNTGESNGAN